MSEKSNDVYKPVCSECASDDVLNDAYAEWDMDSQSWIIQQVFDKGTICQDCGGETSLDWVRFDIGLPRPSEAEGG